MYAKGTSWEPDALDVEFGETVTWHFDTPRRERPHDVWLLARRARDPSRGAGRSHGVVTRAAGRRAGQTTRSARPGAWTFVCTLHSTYNAATPSVDRHGRHRRRGRRPGSRRARARPGPRRPGPSGNPPPAPPGPGVDPLPNPLPTATAAKLGKLPKTKLATFLKRGRAAQLGVRVRPAREGRGPADKRQARKLGLKKATTLAEPLGAVRGQRPRRREAEGVEAAGEGAEEGPRLGHRPR